MSQIIFVVIAIGNALRVFRLHFCYAFAQEQLSVHRHQKRVDKQSGETELFYDTLVTIGSLQNDNADATDQRTKWVSSHWFTNNRRFVSNKFLLAGFCGLSVALTVLVTAVFGVLYQREEANPEDDECLPASVTRWISIAIQGKHLLDAD